MVVALVAPSVGAMDIDSAAVTDAPISARRLPPPLALHLDLPPPEDSETPMDVDVAAAGAAAAASTAGLGVMAPGTGPAVAAAAATSATAAVPAAVPHSPSVGAGGLGGVTGGSAGGGGGTAPVLTSLATAPSVIGFLPPAPGATLAAGDSDAAPYAKIKLDELFFTWLSRPDIRLLVASLLEDAAAGRPLPPPPQSSMHGGVSGGGAGTHPGASPASHGSSPGLDGTASAGSPPHGVSLVGNHGLSPSSHSGGSTPTAPLYSRGVLPLTPSSPVSRFISANVAPPSPRSPNRAVFKLAASSTLGASPGTTPSTSAGGTPKRSSSRTLVPEPGSPGHGVAAAAPSNLAAEVAASPAFLGAQVGRTASFDAVALEEAAASAAASVAADRKATPAGAGDVPAAAAEVKPGAQHPGADDGDARMDDTPQSRGSPASPRRTALDAATVPPVSVSPLLSAAAAGVAVSVGGAAAAAAADKAATAAAEDAMDSIALHDVPEVGPPVSAASSDSDMADVDSEGGVPSSVDRASNTAVASSMGMPDDSAVLSVPVVDGIDMDDDDSGRTAGRGADDDGSAAAGPGTVAGRLGDPTVAAGVGGVAGTAATPTAVKADGTVSADGAAAVPSPVAGSPAPAPAESEQMVDDVTLSSPAVPEDTVMAGTGGVAVAVSAAKKPATATKPPVPRPPASKVAAQAASKAVPVLEAGAIPRFYYPCGRDAEDREARELAASEKFWASRRENPEAPLTDGEVAKLVVEVGGLASFFATLVRTRIIASKEWNPDGSEVLTEDAFKRWYDAECAGVSRDDRMFRALRGDADRDYVVAADFKAVLDSLLACHPGLNFLNATPEFQQRYAETVVERIFYGCARTHAGRLTLRDVRTARLLDTLLLVDEEDDINRERRYFSYEHFYVLYCRFWELDSDHDLLIDRADLQRYGGHALSYRIVDRLFSGAARPLDAARDSASAGLMGYTDFVWFCLSEEDKTSDTAIDFWFRCVDLDGDGVVTLFDCEYFYKEQLRRMENLGHEPVSVEDILCQLLDMIRPSVRPPQIRRRDLKSCRLAPAFFNVLFNLNKFFALESRDPVAIRQQHASPELTDWERFAALEYLRLSAEEEDADEEDWDDNTRAAGAIMGEAPF